MKFLNNGNVQRIPLDQIEVSDRLRQVREVFVENLIVMAEDTGITTPVHVRKTRDGYTLIDGAHRLEAAKRMGLPDIAALVVECRADEARAMEATNNLGAARMTPLQTAMFVASWKRDYYAMHPERKPGVFKGNQHTGNLVGGNLPLTTMMADAFGCDVSTVKRAMRVGEQISREEAEQLDAAPNRISMEDLKRLAKVADRDERAEVVAKIASGAEKSVSKAIKAVKAPVGAPVQDPVDAEFLAVLRAWNRARASARRRFVNEVFDALSPLVVDEAEARDEAETEALRDQMKGIAAK